MSNYIGGKARLREASPRVRWFCAARQVPGPAEQGPAASALASSSPGVNGLSRGCQGDVVRPSILGSGRGLHCPLLPARRRRRRDPGARGAPPAPCLDARQGLAPGDPEVAAGQGKHVCVLPLALQKGGWRGGALHQGPARADARREGVPRQSQPDRPSHSLRPRRAPVGRADPARHAQRAHATVLPDGAVGGLARRNPHHYRRGRWRGVRPSRCVRAAHQPQRRAAAAQRQRAA